jgi:hypothetical protein
VIVRGRLGPKNLRRNRIYKGHKAIASHRFEKALIPLKMYLKSLAILEKAPIPLKKPKFHISKQKSPFLWI